MELAGRACVERSTERDLRTSNEQTKAACIGGWRSLRGDDCIGLAFTESERFGRAASAGITGNS